MEDQRRLHDRAPLAIEHRTPGRIQLRASEPRRDARALPGPAEVANRRAVRARAGGRRRPGAREQRRAGGARRAPPPPPVRRVAAMRAVVTAFALSWPNASRSGARRKASVTLERRPLAA